MSLNKPAVVSRCCFLALTAINFGSSYMYAQYVPPVRVTDPLTQQRVDRLYQRDEVLRTSIQGQRIDRQAEISRLEGRIAKLERASDHPSPGFDSYRFLQLLMTLEEDESNPVAASDASEPEVAQPSMDAQRPTQTTLEYASREKRKRLLQFVANDFMAALNTHILEARILLREESSQLMSLQRLASKGLATGAQVELQQLKSEHAEARFLRLRQQQIGLSELFPDFFPDMLPAPAAEKQPTDSQERAGQSNQNAAESKAADVPALNGARDRKKSDD